MKRVGSGSQSPSLVPHLLALVENIWFRNPRQPLAGDQGMNTLRTSYARGFPNACPRSPNPEFLPGRSGSPGLAGPNSRLCYSAPGLSADPSGSLLTKNRGAIHVIGRVDCPGQLATTRVVHNVVRPEKSGP